MDNWIFGCDVCQDVCPWNSFSEYNQETNFKNKTGFLNFNTNDWNDLNENLFNQVFKRSAVKRTKYSGLKRNIEFIKLK